MLCHVHLQLLMQNIVCVAFKMSTVSIKCLTILIEARLIQNGKVRVKQTHFRHLSSFRRVQPTPLEDKSLSSREDQALRASQSHRPPFLLPPTTHGVSVLLVVAPSLLPLAPGTHRPLFPLRYSCRVNIYPRASRLARLPAPHQAVRSAERAIRAQENFGWSRLGIAMRAWISYLGMYPWPGVGMLVVRGVRASVGWQSCFQRNFCWALGRTPSQKRTEPRWKTQWINKGWKEAAGWKPKSEDDVGVPTTVRHFFAKGKSDSWTECVLVRCAIQ